MKSAKMLIVFCLVLSSVSVYAGGESESETVPEITLHEAVLMGNLKAVEQHINAGSDIDAQDQYGSTALIVAATFGATEAAELLIDAGADLTITNGEGSTPLHVAAFFCRVEIVKALIDAGADVNAVNLAGRTALDSVSAPFAEVKPVYDGIGESLAPLGMKLDYKRIEKTRPEIARMLSS